jgi:hypothetical protein
VRDENGGPQYIITTDYRFDVVFDDRGFVHALVATPL